MFKSLFTNDSLRVVSKSKKTETRGRKTMSKRQKVLNLLGKGAPVAWKTLRNRFDLGSPRALVDTLRSEGNMIYINKTAKGTSLRCSQCAAVSLMRTSTFLSSTLVELGR